MLFITAQNGSAGASDHGSAAHVHKKHAKLKNPVPVTGQSIQAGRLIFEKHCASCHGRDARGGVGPDLTDGQWIHGPSDGEIFHVISDGVAGTSMKGFRDVLSDEVRWHLVNYLANIRKKGKQKRK
jgi:mono/diheme cytochrome c family protein